MSKSPLRWGVSRNGEYKIDIHHPLTVVSANSCYSRALVAVGWVGGGMVLVGGKRKSGRSARDDLIDSNVSFAAILTCQLLSLQMTGLENGSAGLLQSGFKLFLTLYG